MAKAKKNTARWVLQGISGLGIVMGGGFLLAAHATSLGVLRKDRGDLAVLCFGLGLSAIILVIGAWPARDCYRMLRRRSFEGIRSISVIVALTFLSPVVPWLEALHDKFPGDRRGVETLILFVVDIGPLIVAVVIYRICVKLLDRLRESPLRMRWRSGQGVLGLESPFCFHQFVHVSWVVTRCCHSDRTQSKFRGLSIRF